MRGLTTGAALVAVVAFASAAAFAAATSITLQDAKVIIPATSPVSHPKITETQEAVFPGKLTVTGTLSVDYAVGEISIMFEPDAADGTRLPFVADDHRVKSMVFEDKDYDPLVAAALPAAVLADVKAHHNRRARAHVTLDIERYTVAVEGCTGEGYYTAHFVSVHTPGAAKVVPMPPKAQPEEDC